MGGSTTVDRNSNTTGIHPHKDRGKSWQGEFNPIPARGQSKGISTLRIGNGQNGLGIRLSLPPKAHRNTGNRHFTAVLTFLEDTMHLCQRLNKRTGDIQCYLYPYIPDLHSKRCRFAGIKDRKQLTRHALSYKHRGTTGQLYLYRIDSWCHAHLKATISAG